MISAKPIVQKLLAIFFLFGLVVGPKVFADGIPFSEVASTASDDAQGGLINNLKYQAVVSWLQKQLGARYSQYEKFVAKDFGEKYVLDYKVGRVGPDKAQVEITGHLDGEGLRKWIRLIDTKTRATSAFLPVLLISSNAPSANISASQTGTRQKDSVLVQVVTTLTQQALQKFNIKPVPVDNNRLSFSQPVQNEDDVRTLRDAFAQLNQNAAIWFNFTPCKSCGGMRMDTYLYFFPALRTVLAKSDDLTISPQEFNNATALKNGLKTAFQSLTTDVEELISLGGLQSYAYLLRIEGIDTYKNLKSIEKEMAELDYLSKPTMQRAEQKAAQFQVLSPIGAEELGQRLTQQPFSGFHLTLLRVDSKTVVMRYSK